MLKHEITTDTSNENVFTMIIFYESLSETAARDL